MNPESECYGALSGVFSNYMSKQIKECSAPLVKLQDIQPFVPNRHTPTSLRSMNKVDKSYQLDYDYCYWEKRILGSTLSTLYADLKKRKEEHKMGFTLKQNVTVDTYDSKGASTGYIAGVADVQVNSIPLSAGTTFYKRVYAEKVNGKTNNGFSTAIIRLVSTGEGKCVIDLGTNRDFKCRFPSATIQTVTLLAKDERVVSGTGKYNKKGTYVDAKYVHTTRRRKLTDLETSAWIFTSSNTPAFKYVVGTPVLPDYYDSDDRVCAAGIHGYLNAAAAEAYNL